LALQRPEDALESVAARRQETRSLDLELIAVLAKSEMGLRGEAMAILDVAITEFGPDDQLIGKHWISTVTDFVDAREDRLLANGIDA
jgi:hypothetical protein